MEHTVGLYAQRLNWSERRLKELEKELWDMRDRNAEADRIINDLRRKQLGSEHLLDDLRRKHWEDYEAMKKLRGQVKRSDETRKEMGLRLDEANLTVCDLKRQVSEASDVVEGLINRILGFEAEKQTSDRTIMEMELERVEASVSKVYLEHKLLEASNVIQELRTQVLELEADKQRSYETVKEMGIKKQAEASRAAEALDVIRGLREQISTLEDDRCRFDESRKEMALILEEANKTVDDLKMKTSEASGVIKRLKMQILAFEADKWKADQTIKEMEIKQVEASLTADHLKRRNREAFDVIQELRDRLLALEAEKQKSSETIKKMRAKQVEANRTADDLKVKLMEALQSAEGFKTVLIFENLKGNSTKEANIVNAPVFKGEKHYVNNDGLLVTGNVDVEVLSDVAPVVRLTSSPPDYVYSGTRMTDPIDITDDHNKEMTSVPTSIPDLLANVGEKRKIYTPASSNAVGLSPERKRRTLGYGDIYKPDYKRKEQIQKSIHETDEPPSHEPNSRLAGTAQTIFPLTRNQVLKRCAEKAVIRCDSQKQTCNSDSSTDGDSTESEDEDVSETSIYDLLARLQRQKLLKAWNSREDMLKDFNEDVYCLNAVCVLYRQKISTSGSSVGSNGEFFHFDAMGGSDWAEYLIDGDPDKQLKKLVTEVIQERPDVLDKCRQIAWQYSERLFDVYCSGADPFFKSR